MVMVSESVTRQAVRTWCIFVLLFPYPTTAILFQLRTPSTYMNGKYALSVECIALLRWWNDDKTPKPKPRSGMYACLSLYGVCIVGGLWVASTTMLFPYSLYVRSSIAIRTTWKCSQHKGCVCILNIINLYIWCVIQIVVTVLGRVGLRFMLARAIPPTTLCEYLNIHRTKCKTQFVSVFEQLVNCLKLGVQKTSFWIAVELCGNASHEGWYGEFVSSTSNWK